MTERELKNLADNNQWPFIPNPCTIFNRQVPYLDPQLLSIVTANSSAGKTSFTKYWMFQYLEFAIVNNFKFKIIWLALEETTEQFIFSVKSYFLYKKYGMELNMADMMSVSIKEDGSRRILSKDEVDACENVQQYVDEFMSYIELKIFNDEHNPANPTGIYKFIREKAFDLGTFTHNGKIVNKEFLNNGATQSTGFVDYSSNYYTICVVDNVNNLQSESGLDSKATIRKFVGYYANSLITKWLKIHVILLQQQWKASMNLDHITAGHIYPTLDGLADDKNTGNDCRLAIGITDIFEHEKNYSWPPTTKIYRREDWKDKMRVLNIPKNTMFGARITTTDKMIPMKFIPKASYFEKI